MVNRGPKGGYNVKKKIHTSSANFNENVNKNIKTMNLSMNMTFSIKSMKIKESILDY
jgi:hypothetical protein